mmetsp:Transcript_6669/g.18502  ORF Transcript_6669/g.18502 Transcript_6669/m.18502 type:complete len:317 (-) Transcript_6669:300-1250(-)
MSDCDGAAVGIHLGLVDAEMVHRVLYLARKRLVDLVHINIIQMQPCRAHSGGDCRRRPDTHDRWGYAHGRETAEHQQHGQPAPPSLLPRHEHARRRPIRHLGRISRRRRSPILLEDGREPLQRLHRRARPDPVVLGDHHLFLLARLGILDRCANRDNLILELSRRARGRRLLVRRNGKLILGLAIHPEALRNDLTRHTHREQTVRGALIVRDARVHAALPRHRIRAHALDAPRNANRIVPSLDGRRDARDRLQTGRALAVDSVHRHGFRKSCEEHGHPALVGPLGRGPEHRAHDHIADGRRLDPGALDGLLEHSGH